MPQLVKKGLVLRLPEKASFGQRLLFAFCPPPTITAEEYEKAMQCGDRNRHHVHHTNENGPNTGDQSIQCLPKNRSQSIPCVPRILSVPLTQAQRSFLEVKLAEITALVIRIEALGKTCAAEDKTWTRTRQTVRSEEIDLTIQQICQYPIEQRLEKESDLTRAGQALKDASRRGNQTHKEYEHCLQRLKELANKLSRGLGEHTDEDEEQEDDDEERADDDEEREDDDEEREDDDEEREDDDEDPLADARSVSEDIVTGEAARHRSASVTFLDGAEAEAAQARATVKLANKKRGHDDVASYGSRKKSKV